MRCEVYSTTFDNQTHLDLIRPIISNATALRALKLCQPLPSTLPPVDEKILVDLVVSSVPVRSSHPARMNFASIPPPALRMSRLGPFQIPEPGSPPCVLKRRPPHTRRRDWRGVLLLNFDTSAMRPSTRPVGASVDYYFLSRFALPLSRYRALVTKSCAAGTAIPLAVVLTGRKSAGIGMFESHVQYLLVQVEARFLPLLAGALVSIFVRRL